MNVRCIACGRRKGSDGTLLTCPSCGGLLEVETPLPSRRPRFEARGVWRYRALLPVRSPDPVTLDEGSTGLHPLPRAARILGLRALFVKHEGENPTGSFKDRGMAVGVTLARSLGRRVLVCASTGNTAASLAAYAARAGMKAVVLLPAGQVAAGKIAQAVAHAARLVQIDGTFDHAMALVRGLEREGGAYILNSLNPYRLEGQKTIAYEIAEALGEPPDAVVLPIGNGGNVGALWKGFKEWKAMGLARRLPRLVGVQASGAAPVAKAFITNRPMRVVAAPATVATAIRIGNPVNAPKALAALRESRGEAGTVTDREILDAQRWLAATEGVFVEPASAAPVAYVRRHARRFRGVRSIVLVATGHGLKDPEVLTSRMPRARLVRPTLGALRRVLD